VRLGRVGARTFSIEMENRVGRPLSLASPDVLGLRRLRRAGDAVVIFVGCKWLTWRRTLAPGAQWWQHAGYLFAWLSLFNARELAGGSRLARWVCGYNAVFWGVRLALQWIFDVKEHLSNWWLRVGYYALTILFAGFTLLYGFAALLPIK
jgi:hypothetical protein